MAVILWKNIIWHQTQNQILREPQFDTQWAHEKQASGTNPPIWLSGPSLSLSSSQPS